ERVPLDEPAHRDLPAFALDLLGRDRAALLGDVEERLEQQAALGSSAREPAWLIGAGERVENRLDRRDAPGVLARDRVDPAPRAHEMEESLGDERRGHVRRDELIALGARAARELRDHVALLDARVDALLEHARR